MPSTPSSPVPSARSTPVCCPSCQIALARNGELEVFEAYGDATTDTRYIVFSATKAFVASLVWVLIGEGLIDVSKRVVDYIPEFAPNGKDVITVEQVMLHTSGFPYAPLGMPDMADARGPRRADGGVAPQLGAGLRPTSTTPTSAHWVLVEIIDRVTGGDYRDLLEERVTRPAGIDRPRARRHRRRSRRVRRRSARRPRPTSSRRCSASASSRSPR